MRIDSTVQRVAETVVAVLREPVSDQLPGKLATLRLEEWESSYHWLDANGLALYFRDALQRNHLESCIPCGVLARLDRCYTDNQSRLEHHLVEFQAINHAFQAAGIHYANLKGFTLEPDYCRDLSLRYQCDLDFTVRRNDAMSCRVVLQKLGYRLTSETSDTLEFKPAEDRLPDIADLYKPRNQQAVEVHFGSPTGKLDLDEGCLDHVAWISRFSLSFPVVGELDMFFSLIFHLYRHLLSEWVRLSWFLELDWFLQRRARDVAFWRTVLERADADNDTAQALALVMAFCKQAFSRSLPDSLAAICSTQLREPVQLWVAHYGSEILFSDFPGNKLYLLLLRELSRSHNDWQDTSRKKLFPFHAPATVLHSNNWAERTSHIPGNAKYGLLRVSFHLREGFRYLLEQWRWRRRSAQSALLKPGSE